MKQFKNISALGKPKAKFLGRKNSKAWAKLRRLAKSGPPPEVR